MNQDIDWYDRSRQRAISQNRVPMVSFTTDYRRGFRGRDDYNTYGGRGNNPFNHGQRNNFRHSQQQPPNSYNSGICRDFTSYGSVRPISGFSAPVESTGSQGFLVNNFNRDPSASEVTGCIPSRPILPGAPTFEAPKRFTLKDEPSLPSKLPTSNISAKNRAFGSSSSASWKPSIGHGPAPLPPISNLEIHTPLELPSGFQVDTRVPPPPIGQVDLARPPPPVSAWYQNGIGYPGAPPFLPPQPASSSLGAGQSRQPNSQQIPDERSNRLPNNKQISPPPDVKSTTSERSDASKSESIPSLRSNVKEEVDDDDDVICVTDLNAKTNSPPLDTFIRFVDANYSGLFQIINPSSKKDWLSVMETFLQNLEDDLFQIDDKIRLWMYVNMVMISTTQGASFANIELDNYLDFMERFFEIYFNLMKQIFQQAWKLGQVPDCKDIAVNCILMLSRCFFNRYDRILNCFLERQIPMDVKGLPQVWFLVLSYLLTVSVNNFLEEDGYRIYLIWQKFRALCETPRLVENMDRVVKRRLREMRVMKENFYVQDILEKQSTDKTYNWWDMIQDYFKYMECRKRTALESYNYSYMYPGNPDSLRPCYIAPARISHKFKPFYESLFAWTRDDTMARLFDKAETDFNIAKREIEKGFQCSEIDLTELPGYVDPNFVPPKPKPIPQAWRILTRRRVKSNKSKILRSLSTIVISDSDSEGDDHLSASHSSPCNNIVDLTSLDEDVVIIDADSKINDIVSLEDEVKHDNVQERTGEVGNCSGAASIEARTNGEAVEKRQTESNNSDMNKDSEAPNIEMCPEESFQEGQNQSEKHNKPLDTLPQGISEQPIEIANNLEECLDGIDLETQLKTIQPSEQACSDKPKQTHGLTSPDPAISKDEVMNNIEEKLLSSCDIGINKPLQISMPGTQKIESNQRDIITVVEKPNCKITNDLFDIEPTATNAATVKASILKEPNNTETLVQSESAGLEDNKSATGIIYRDIVIAEADSNNLTTACRENLETDDSSKVNAGNVSLVQGKFPSSESDAVDGSEHNLNLGKHPPNNDAVNLFSTPYKDEGNRSKTGESVVISVNDNLEDRAQAPADILDIPKNTLIEHKTTADVISFEAAVSNLNSVESCPSQKTLNAIVQPIILPKNDPEEYNSSGLAEAHTLEENKSYEKSALLDNSLTQLTYNIPDESGPGILEEQCGALKDSPLELNLTPAVVVGRLAQSTSNTQDVTAFPDGISNKPNANVCHVPDTNVHEGTLFKSTSDLPKPRSVEVHSLDSHVSNKEETSDQKINLNEIESSKSDANITFAWEAQMDISAKCNVNESNDKVAIRGESCDLEASWKNAQDTVATNHLEVRHSTAEKTHADDDIVLKIIPTESSIIVPMLNVDEYPSSEHFETPAPQVSHLEPSTGPHEIDITRSALVSENPQQLFTNYYTCAYVPEPCTKNITDHDGSVLSDECSRKSNSNVIIEGIKQYCRKSIQSKKRKASNCEDSVDTKRSHVTWSTKTAIEGDLQTKILPDELSDIENGSDEFKLSDASIEIASPPFEMLNKEKVKSHFEEGMKQQTLTVWKYGELSSSSVLTSTNDATPSTFDSNSCESPMDLSNMCKSGIDHHAEFPSDDSDENLIGVEPTNCRDLYEAFCRAESEVGELLGGTYDQQQSANKEAVKAEEVPGTSTVTEPSYTGVNSEESSLIYLPRSETIRFPKKRSVSKYRTQERNKVHFNVDEDEFQNGLEGPVGKPMPYRAEHTSNFFWNDSEPPYSVSVKPDCQLKEERTLKLESILKKPNVKNVDNHVKINSTVSPNAPIEQRRLYENQHEEVYSQSNFNESASVHLNEIGVDPYLYLSIPVLLGDGSKTPSPSEAVGLVELDPAAAIKDNGLAINFKPYEPAQVPFKYPMHQSTPAPSTEFQVRRESGQEVKLALPPKKRKLTEEEELNIIVTAKYMEDSEQSQKLQKSYPAERQMSIAEIQRDNPKIRTLAARKEYPTSPQVYQEPVKPLLTEEQNVNYQKYPDQCPDQRGNITNFFITGVQHFSHKLNMPSDKHFWVMMGPMDSEGQCTAPQETPLLEQNCPIQANLPVLPPLKAKRGRKPSTVAKPPGVKRGRGRPRKNPL